MVKRGKKKKVSKKTSNKKPIKSKSKNTNKNISNKSFKKNNIIIIILIGVLIIIAGYFLINNLNKSEEEIIIDSEVSETPKSIKLNALEWRNPKKITPYGGRFYETCEDGKNLGQVWLDIGIENQEPGLFFTCKINIISEDRKYVDSFQMNINSGQQKSSFIGYSEELAKNHNIDVCCKNNDKNINFCQVFELKAFC